MGIIIVYRKIIVSIVFLFFAGCVFGQENNSKKKEQKWYKTGTIYGKIFANFHSSLNKHEQDNGFEVNRAYFGYKNKLSDEFFANVKIDIGNPNDIQDYAAKKRFAYFKNAYIQYKKNKLSISFGIADCYQFKLQEKVWGYRYFYQSMQDKHKFGSSADIGIFADYKINDLLSIDASFSNGEGYSTLQSDDNFKTSLGISLKMIEIFTLRFYYDHFTTLKNPQSNYVSFLAVNWKKIVLGTEFNYQTNANFRKNRNRTGFSVYGTFRFLKNIKILGRYDYVSSNQLKGEKVQWNLAKDGSAIIAGVEYSPINKINISLNYQDWVSYATNGIDHRFLYVSLQASF